MTFDNPGAVVRLLEALSDVGAGEQVAALAERAATHITPDDPGTVSRLLQTLRRAGADEQVTTLAERAATHVALDDPGAVSRLLQALREVGANQQVTTLTERLRAAGRFGLFINLGENRDQFQLGCEPDGSPAPSWTWNDLD